MNQQPIKRRSPFDIPKVEQKVEEPVEEVVNEDFVEEFEEQPVYEEVKPVIKQPVRQQPVQRQIRQSQKQQYFMQDDANREKYTSTMDIGLRRQIKIVCATRGIMFAKFVEDACREKLQREGGR